MWKKRIHRKRMCIGRLAFVILFCIMGVCDMVEAEECCIKIVQAKTAVYEQPDTKSEILGWMDKEEDVYVIGEEENWSIIFYKGIEGYIDKDYLKTQAEKDALAEEIEDSAEVEGAYLQSADEEVYYVNQNGTNKFIILGATLFIVGAAGGIYYMIKRMA